MLYVVVRDLICFNSGLKEGDAVFVTSAYAFEDESIDALKTFFSQWNKEVFIIGPLLPSGYGTVTESARGSKETEDFLERAKKKHGERSVTLASLPY